MKRVLVLALATTLVPMQAFQAPTRRSRRFHALQVETNEVSTSESSTLDEVLESEPLMSDYQRVETSTTAAAALVAGTAVGAGILALPTATAAAGILPSTVALTIAWLLMTASGLCIAELSLERQGSGLLQLYKENFERASLIGAGAYFFLHYAMMVAYLAQGGQNVADVIPAVQPIAPLVFGGVTGGSLYWASQERVNQVNNALVLGVIVSFVSIVGLGVTTVDWSSLGHSDVSAVWSSLPILFLALVYQNVVPTIVTQLRGDRKKIQQAIVSGTTIPFVMFVGWNTVVLGNLKGEDVADPVRLLQSNGGELLGPLVASFSSLALITSLIGFTYGLVDAWTDVLGIENVQGSESFERNKIKLFSLVFGPPLLLSMGNPNIFYQALEYGGAFGVSTLFLILPPFMIWKQRYSEGATPSEPMLPFGKAPLFAMWGAAAVIVGEQVCEKVGLM